MIEARVRDVDLKFETGPGLFSPKWLDAGSLAMLQRVAFEPSDRVLDLGCGYGLVGVLAARLIGPERVVLSDIDPEAVAAAKANLVLNGVTGALCVVSDGFKSLRESGFTQIICHPPYHSDFSVAKHLIEKGFNRLVVGGRMWMVTRRLDWYRNKLTAIFGGVKVHETDGYFVFEAEKRKATYAAR